MKTACLSCLVIVIVLVNVAQTYASTSQSLRTKVFVEGDNMIQCSKDKPCPSEQPCCTVHGFCGNRRYHCLRSFACAFGCREEDGNGQSSSSSSSNKNKEAPVALNSAPQKIIIKTISTPVPVCRNCDGGKGENNNAAPQQQAAPVTERKKVEDTIVSITETKPKPKVEKQPTCANPPCDGKNSKNSGNGNDNNNNNSGNNNNNNNNNGNQQQQQQQKQSFGNVNGQISGSNQMPNAIFVRVTGRSLKGSEHRMTLPITVIAGTDSVTANVLNPKGY